ncbi:hypothetical protein [Streptomyces sp. NPDC001843]|uniref:hypothetical protein n=1 Tax=Streptomyces sp. NPDC001843 TaxID=3364617 RepID=UPI0036AB87EB
MRIRELRWAAYLELMEQAHVTGQLYRRVLDARFQLTEREPLLARIHELRMELREAYASLMRSVRVIALEGPSATSAAAEAVLEAARETNRALWLTSLEENDARARFDEANSGFTRWLERFVETARAAMEAP